MRISIACRSPSTRLQPGHRHRRDCAAQQAKLRPLRQAGRVLRYVKAAGLDPIKDGRAAAGKQVNVDGQRPGMRGTRARPRRAESRARATSNRSSSANAGVNRRACRSDVGIAEPGPILARQINAADGQVAGDILPEIGQLKGRAGGVGQVGVFR